MKRGDVVLVYIPYVDGPGGKTRPAVVVQRDEDNAKLAHTIVAAITTNLRNVTEPTQHRIDPADPEGRAAGVLHPSAIRCDRLFTVEQRMVIRTIGQLTPGTLARVDECLRAALGLSP
jgi:mRNA interferase MazF